MNGDVFIALRQAVPQLSKSEQRIAKAVLADPSVVVDSTITELAERYGTSVGSVARFCHAVGFAGFRDFRVAIAAANSREEAARESFRVADADIDPADSALEVVAKVAYQEARTIEETARTLDLDVLDQAVAAVRDAKRIDVFGAGSSGLIAQDLHQKLHRIGLMCFCFSDPHLALASFALSGPDCLAIGISHTGQTVETHQMLELAAAQGATTLAITNYPRSPIGELADLVLTTAARETRFRSGAMSSRIAQMALVDFLVVRLLQGSYDETSALLRATYRAIQPHRFDRSGGE
ncbi:MurR/RpiR family transcriptional regulator [Microbacterium sp. BWT-B31]|uniref:MurR/RpiR family transcriptional regulator n=1 Tax=Microbacterium sp. BWT-B31 TaxID=3232072 RepID=UPI00352834DA